MKKFQRVALVIFILLFFNVKSIQAQDTLYNQLRNLNLTTYLNKPIDSLISKIPAGYTQLIVEAGSYIDYAGRIIVVYPNNFNIDIRAKDFQYVTKRNVNYLPPAQAWPINLMRKEKIDVITIYRNWNIINSAGE